MKHFLIVLLTLSLHYAYSQEITKRHHSFPLSQQSKIVIELEGDIILTGWDSSKVNVEIESVISGVHFALGGGKNSMKEYDIAIEDSSGTVFIRRNPLKSSFTMGVSTLRAERKHFLSLPKSAHIVVNSKNANIVVKENFNIVDIENKEGTSTLELNDEGIGFMKCSSAKGNVVVNKKLMNGKHEMSGGGRQIYLVTSQSGEIDISIAKTESRK